ncbi:hypothetical protein GQX74_001524 [Glossina fuscipes]|nr:hypothetical protein GQX74_001524 [Glossina fuscipes]
MPVSFSNLTNSLATHLSTFQRFHGDMNIHLHMSCIHLLSRRDDDEHRIEIKYYQNILGSECCRCFSKYSKRIVLMCSLTFSLFHLTFTNVAGNDILRLSTSTTFIQHLLLDK